MAAHAHSDTHGHAHAHEHGHVPGQPHVHIAPIGLYLGIFGALMVLTVVTVLVAYVNVGPWNKVVALSIASFKATLVVLYFMHVKYASKLTQLTVVSGLFFLAILLGLTMIDYASRMWVNPPALLQ